MIRLRVRASISRLATIGVVVWAGACTGCTPPNRAYAQLHPVPQPQAIQRISLEYTGCLGTCPAYKIELHRSGEAHYWGRSYASMLGHYVGVVDTLVFEWLAVHLVEGGFFDSTPRPDRPLPTDVELHAICAQVGTESYCVERGGGPWHASLSPNALDRDIAEVVQRIKWRFADDLPGLPSNRRLKLPGASAGRSIERLGLSRSRSLTRRLAWCTFAPAA
jgi:hypothetical protein